MEALPKWAPRLEEQCTASASSSHMELCKGTRQLENSFDHWLEEKLKMSHRESLDWQRATLEHDKEEQPHRGCIIALKLHNIIFMIFNCQLGLCCKPGCLDWVQKIWTAHENFFLFKLKSPAAFTCISTGWCQSHRESSWAKMTLAQTDDAHLTSKAKKKVNVPKPHPWFSILILIEG